MEVCRGEWSHWTVAIFNGFFANSRELLVWMTYGLLDGSKNFCKLLSVSREASLLHGHDWIQWVVKSCTATAYRWLFFVFYFSHWVLCDLLLPSHPKFSARGTTSPVRFLHGALVILVLWRILQFWSFGKCVQKLWLPNTTRLCRSREGSWEELACESLCLGTLSSTIFLWIQAAIIVFRNVTVSPVLLVILLFICFSTCWLGFLTGLPVLARLHSHIQLMVGVDPVLSCGTDVRTSEPDALDDEEDVDNPGTTIGT